MANKINKKDIEFYAREWIKCKNNIFYYIYNYAYLVESTGELIKITPKNLHPKMKITIRVLLTFERAVLMASRQLGKSSVAALILSWATVFFPHTRVIILNMKKNAAFENLNKIKDIISNLPDWMLPKKKFKSDSSIKTYLTLFNDSKIEVFYPSTVHNVNTLARSLTAPILYIDEAAFIGSNNAGMREIYGSAQSTLSKAREQAKKVNRPTFTLITSTPNGTIGVGKWFYDRYMNAIDSNLLFDSKTGLWLPDIDKHKIVNESNSNKYIKIKYHWSEDPSKDQQWYEDQCAEIADQRTINQELDLIFVGSTDCIFTDEILSAFKSKPPCSSLTTPNLAKLDIFTNKFDINDYYLIGCDTAESLLGNYCTIEIYSFKNFNQIAELQFKYGSYTKFGQDIDFVFRWLAKQINNRMQQIILCNENNSIGRAPIEYLINNINDINYVNYLYKSNINNLSELGIKTTGMTKPLMVGCLMQALNENPKGIKSQNLIDQLSGISKTNTGSFKSSLYDDLFMASCFCALIRSKKYMEIGPLLVNGSEKESKKQYESLVSLAKTFNPKQKIQSDNQFIINDDNYDDYYYEDDNNINDDYDPSVFTQVMFR